ncbi:MAG TPA: hypothetical protein VHZ02_10585 [Acidimicrobiales bacterium]|nr:hypothetical protein [Acidimicrobiales bacterium]
MTAVPPPSQTGIIVRSKVFPLAFLLLLFKTTVTIDGVPIVIKWGEHFFPAAPGTHEVRVSFKYIFGDMGENLVTVQVAPGQTPRVNYRSPFLVFMKGKIEVGS